MSFNDFEYRATAARQHQDTLIQHAAEHRLVRLARRRQHDTWRHKPREGPVADG